MTSKTDIKVEGINKFISNILVGIGSEIEKHAKLVAPVDRGAMRAGIHYALLEPFRLIVTSTVKYDIFWETGTRKHFLPFFEYRGKGELHGPINDFGRWAQRVMGLSEQQLAEMGGIQVQAEKRRLYSGGVEEAVKHIGDIVKAAAG